MINGDKSQDIGDAERRSLIEIKEAIIRVQTAPAMDIIAEKDLADKNIQARLKVEIEKFDPNDPTLSEKVRERLDELKAEGKEIVAFYDKKTGKIFINQNAKDDEVRASIAREYKIKEDLELGRGKENDKGQLRSTVAGEIAYDEIKDRLKKGDKNPISASSFDVAKMDKDSEVTSDKYGEAIKGLLKIGVSGAKYSRDISEMNDNPDIIYKDPEGAKKKVATALDKLNKDYDKNVDDIVEGWNRPEYAKKEMPILKEKIDKEKDPKMRNLLIARYGYLEKEAYPFDTFMKELNKGTAKGFIAGVVIKAAMNTPQGRGITLGIIGAKALYDIYQGAKEEPKIAITFTQANDIKKIAPEFYKDAESLFRIGNKSEVSNSALIGAAENYYKNNKTPDGKTGDIVGFLAGAKVGGDFAGKALNRPVTYIYKSPNPSLVPVNGATNGEQLFLEYKAMNTLPATNGTLAPSLTTSGALATIPLLTDGANKVSQVASKLPYNPVLKSPVKYPNLTDSENKFLNDYMGKEIPGKIVSKYNDVNKYEYNATTNPGPLSIGDDPQINNFYGGRYNKRILEKPEVYFRARDSGYEKEFGSYYTKDFPKSSIQVRTDSAVKLYWTDENRVLTWTSPLNRVYMIEFPAGTEIYEGPIGYQEGRYLGGLENEQIYIEKAWKKGALKSSFPLERKKELVLPSEENMK